MVRNKQEVDGYYTSRIPIGSMLKGSLAEVEEALTTYPDLELIGNDSCLKYTLCKREFSGYFYTLELGKNCIVIEICSRTSPFYLIGEALLRLLSIAAILKEFYVLELDSLYPYLISVIGRSVISDHMEALEDSQRLNDQGGEVVLSERIIELLNENKNLAKNLKLCEKKIANITCYLIAIKYSGKVTLERITNELGLDTEELRRVLEAMGSVGYRVNWFNGREFTVVKQ